MSQNSQNSQNFQKNSQKKGFITGILFFIVAFFIFGISYMLMFDPPANSSMTVNGKPVYPGQAAYTQTVLLIGAAGVFFLLIGIIVFVSSYYAKNNIKSKHFRTIKNYQFANAIENSDSDKFYDPNSNSLPKDENSWIYDSSSNAALKQSPSSTQNYNPAQTPPPAQNYNTFQSSAPSQTSELHCSSCGSAYKPEETFCPNCGARVQN